jgi:O-antigen/teichoic acid export membrane protein
MTAMNVAAYAFTLLAARRLGPDGYSVVAALMGVVLVVNVLALGVQATTARQVARHGADPRVAAEMVRTAVRSAVALGSLCLVLSPVAAVLLHLDSWLTAATVAVTAAALTITGAQLGILQGHRSWRAFAGLSLTTGAGRLVVGGAAVVLWPTPLGAMTGVALGAVAPLLVGRRLTRPGPNAMPAGEGGPPSRARRGGTLRDLLHDSHTLLAFFALTQVDVFAARVVLPADEAGVYASGLILTKAVLFLPTFVTVMAFPTLARRTGHRHLHLAGLGVVLAIGLVAVGGTLVMPRLALAFVGGPAYATVQPYLWLFAVLGTVIAMIQLLVQTALARAHRHAVWWVWGALATVLAGVPFVTTGQALLVLVLAVDTLLLAVLVRVTWADRWVGTAPGEGNELIDQALPGGVASAEATSAPDGVSARRRARTGPPRR